MKKLILVSSPPACGKTYVSRKLAKALGNVVYLDKDTLIPLSKQIFRVAKKPYNRSSDFFEENVRDYEYETILALGLEALGYADTVIINAPFTRELRNPELLSELKKRISDRGARLTVIWVVTNEDVCRERMMKRHSDRDGYKISHWNDYVKTIDFSVPAPPNDDPEVDLLLFYNSSEAEFIKSMHDVTCALQNE